METKDYVIVGIAALVLLMSIIQAFQISSMKSQITANAVKTDSGVDMSGWTENEKMMYEHHGTLPARVEQNSKQASNMVGGC